MAGQKRSEVPSGEFRQTVEATARNLLRIDECRTGRLRPVAVGGGLVIAALWRSMTPESLLGTGDKQPTDEIVTLSHSRMAGFLLGSAEVGPDRVPKMRVWRHDEGSRRSVCHTVEVAAFGTVATEVDFAPDDRVAEGEPGWLGQRSMTALLDSLQGAGRGDDALWPGAGRLVEVLGMVDEIPGLLAYDQMALVAIHRARM